MIMWKKIPKTAIFQTPMNLNSTGPKLGRSEERRVGKEC